MEFILAEKIEDVLNAAIPGLAERAGATEPHVAAGNSDRAERELQYSI
jgi:hypothetical protein